MAPIGPARRPRQALQIGGGGRKGKATPRSLLVDKSVLMLMHPEPRRIRGAIMSVLFPSKAASCVDGHPAIHTICALRKTARSAGKSATSSRSPYAGDII